MRTEWVERRSKDPIPTQIYYGRQGVVTEEMEYVARRERLSAETIRDEVARGRMIIPADALGHRRHHGLSSRNQAHHPRQRRCRNYIRCIFAWRSQKSSLSLTFARHDGQKPCGWGQHMAIAKSAVLMAAAAVLSTSTLAQLPPSRVLTLDAGYT